MRKPEDMSLHMETSFKRSSLLVGREKEQTLSNCCEGNERQVVAVTITREHDMQFSCFHVDARMYVYIICVCTYIFVYLYV